MKTMLKTTSKNNRILRCC